MPFLPDWLSSALPWGSKQSSCCNQADPGCTSSNSSRLDRDSYSSQVGANPGLSANTFFYNLTNGLSMLFGRYLFIVPMMAVAGSLVAKKVVPPSAGTFPTNGGTYVALLVSVILIMGGLIYFPALALGPIVEQLLMIAGKLF